MDHVTSRDGTTIAYVRDGEGPPAVVVGGALSEHSSALPLVAELAPTMSVIAYDRRGRGASGDSSPGVDGAVERELDDLAALLDLAGGGATLIGKSSGGLLALAAAAAGLPVDRLVIFEAPLATPDFPLSAPPDLPEQLAALVAEGRRGDAVELFLTGAVGLPADAVAQMRHLPDWPAREAMAASTVYDTALSRQYPRPEAFASVGVPVLVLDGETTYPMLHAAAIALADALPDAEHRTIAGTDHQFDPPALAAAVRAFLGQD